MGVTVGLRSGSALWDRLQRRFHGRREAGVPTMLTQEEVCLLRRLTSERYTGAGTVVDCGPFLGGSTSALCAGLRQNPRAAGRDGFVHVFDRFIYDGYFRHWFHALGDSLQEGDSFLPAFENLNAQYLDLLTLYPGDVLASKYEAGPIEILFIDLCKSWEINAHVVRQFFPHLVPGKSFVVQQDYVHFFAFWLVLTMDWFRDYFERVGHVAEGHSALYRCVRAIPPGLLAMDLRLIPLGRKCEAFERELERCSGWQHTEILVGYYRMLVDAGALGAARAVAMRIPPSARKHPINQVALTFVDPHCLSAA